MIDNVEATELAVALASVASLTDDVIRLESDCAQLRSNVESAERDTADAQSEQEDAEAQAEALQEELDQIHEGVGLRSIIERAWAVDPIATENDLLSAGLGAAVAVLRIDHQQGRLNFAGAQ